MKKYTEIPLGCSLDVQDFFDMRGQLLYVFGKCIPKLASKLDSLREHYDAVFYSQPLDANLNEPSLSLREFLNEISELFELIYLYECSYMERRGKIPSFFNE